MTEVYGRDTLCLSVSFVVIIVTATTDVSLSPDVQQTTTRPRCVEKHHGRYSIPRHGEQYSLTAHINTGSSKADLKREGGGSSAGGRGGGGTEARDICLMLVVRQTGGFLSFTAH